MKHKIIGELLEIYLVRGVDRFEDAMEVIKKFKTPDIKYHQITWVNKVNKKQ